MGRKWEFYERSWPGAREMKVQKPQIATGRGREDFQWSRSPGRPVQWGREAIFENVPRAPYVGGLRSGSTAPGVCPPPVRRDAAFAPLRLDGTPRLPPSGSTGRRVCPPPARLRAPPSRRLPLKGGVILERLMQASYHSPLEGESQKPSRLATADAVGGGRRGPRLRRAATPGRFSAVPERTAFPERRRRPYVYHAAAALRLGWHPGAGAREL